MQKPLTVFRVAHKNDLLFGPEGTRDDGMPRCMAWEISNASFLSIPKFKKGRIFGFTLEQIVQVLSDQAVAGMEEEGFVIHVLIVKSYEVHEDQVTFDLEGSEAKGFAQAA